MGRTEGIDMRCIRCGSERVTTGALCQPGTNVPAVFRPDGIRPLSFTPRNGTDLDATAHACLGCGLVWAETPVDKMSTFIRRHCNKETREALELP